MSSLFSDKSNFLLLASSSLEKTKETLQEILKELALQTRPFPGFLNMKTIQAIEIPVPETYSSKYGCVVVLPDGEINEIILKTIPAPESLGEVDQTEEYVEVDMPVIDTIIYLYNAIEILCNPDNLVSHQY
jgi:hypothetical protein|tara:strand:- start:393 stop:785 length:393 start_codon:yes stop_codon:yes gene_type:complete